MATTSKSTTEAVPATTSPSRLCLNDDNLNFNPTYVGHFSTNAAGKRSVRFLRLNTTSIGLISGETETEPVKEASSYRLLDAANSNTVEGFFTARPETIEKNCAVVAGFRRPL